MCQWGKTIATRVLVHEALSASGHDQWEQKVIDACIAPLVEALQQSGINMYGSCCGHGKDFGFINLWDGRVVAILPCEYPHWRFALRVLFRSLRWALREWLPLKRAR